MGYAGVAKAVSNHRCLGEMQTQGGMRCLGGCSLQQKGDKKQLQDNNSLKPAQTSLQLASEHV